MNWKTFNQSLEDAAPPASLDAALEALWHDGRGDWESAHVRIQSADDASSAWVHAYLHRKEGDNSNAAYWYRRAGKPVFAGTLPDEWHAIAQALLEQDDGADHPAA